MTTGGCAHPDSMRLLTKITLATLLLKSIS
jgi:hypothetical protein